MAGVLLQSLELDQGSQKALEFLDSSIFIWLITGKGAVSNYRARNRPVRIMDAMDLLSQKDE